jgi:DNA-directed RNA polymerase sigma subunit (sigma70/sigma32)
MRRELNPREWVAANPGLVYSAATRALRGVPQEDTMQDVWVGVLAALPKFDPRRGQLPTYVYKRCLVRCALYAPPRRT